MRQFRALEEMKKGNESSGCCVVILGVFRCSGFEVQVKNVEGK